MAEHDQPKHCDEGNTSQRQSNRWRLSQREARSKGDQEHGTGLEEENDKLGLAHYWVSLTLELTSARSRASSSGGSDSLSSRWPTRPLIDPWNTRDRRSWAAERLTSPSATNGRNTNVLSCFS